MKRIICMLFMLLSGAIYGQKAFYSMGNAMEDARKKDQKILLIFSGSDWCKPCIQLKKEVLDTPIFSSLCTDLIVLHLDFPYKRKNKLSKEQTKHNEQLAEKYNKTGQFPHVVLINADGEETKTFQYEKGLSAEDFAQKIKSLL